MQNKHTPGPWKHDEAWGLIKHGKEEICALHSRNKANADLIVAAPLMLEALKGFIEYYEAYNPITDKRIEPYVVEARRAIARAEGKAGV